MIKHPTPSEIVAACKTAKQKLAREMADLDPIEVLEVERARMRMRSLDRLEAAAKSASESMELTQDQQTLLALAG